MLILPVTPVREHPGQPSQASGPGPSWTQVRAALARPLAPVTRRSRSNIREIIHPPRSAYTVEPTHGLIAIASPPAKKDGYDAGVYGSDVSFGKLYTPSTTIPAKPHDEQFTLVNKATGKPLSNAKYKIVKESGETIEAVTDAEGKTMRVVTNGAEQLVVHLIH